MENEKKDLIYKTMTDIQILNNDKFKLTIEYSKIKDEETGTALKKKNTLFNKIQKIEDQINELQKELENITKGSL